GPEPPSGIKVRPGGRGLLPERIALVRPARCVLAMICALAGACADGTPTAPSAAPGYDGQWSGMSSQGRPVTFTVSSNHVTAVTVEYVFGGFSGSKTFSNVNVEIASPSGSSPGGQPTPPNAPPGF